MIPASQEMSSRSGVILRVPISGAPPPRQALEALGGLAGRILFESADSRGRYSFLGAAPLMTLRAGGDGAVLLDATGRSLGTFADIFDGLERLLPLVSAPAPVGRIAFPGGIIGCLAYEAGDALEQLPAPPPDDTGMPLAWFGVYERLIAWDHLEGTCSGVATVLPGGVEGRTADRLAELIDLVTSSGGSVASWKAGTDPAGGPAAPSRRDLVTSLDRNGYEAGVERIREHIRAGDLFQANLTRRISAPTELSGTALYGRLVERSPAAFSAYLDTGNGEVASVSPELFLRARSGKVTTRPIKGTAGRGASPEADRALADGLVASEKDRAENVMIVDLLRNDLSRVCRPGSVRVPDLVALESHAAVHHLVSTVEGQLEKGVGPVDLLRATFPGGSVTGAPKIRAMEILRDIEPVRRGIYTGAIGILGFHGDLEASVAIRTAVVNGGYASYGTGGGITLASVASEEWRESELKAAPFLSALGASSDPT